MKCPRCGTDGMEMISNNDDEVDLWFCDECYTAWWIDQYYPTWRLKREYRPSEGKTK